MKKNLVIIIINQIIIIDSFKIIIKYCFLYFLVIFKGNFIINFGFLMIMLLQLIFGQLLIIELIYSIKLIFVLSFLIFILQILI